MKVKKIIKLIVVLTCSILVTVTNVIPNGVINTIYGAEKKSITIVNKPGTTFGTKAQLKLNIKAAAKQPKGSSKATYLAGLNLNDKNGDVYTTTKEEFIDTTRFTLFIQKNVEIPVNLVQTLNSLMDILETKTGENFYSKYYQDGNYNYLLGEMETYFKTANQLKKSISSKNKILIFILNDKNAYTYSYGTSGCIINTSDTPLYTDAIASQLIDHFLFVLLSRNGGNLQSCLSSGFVNYYKEKILATYSVFNTQSDGYSSMSDIHEKIDKASIEKLLNNANAGDDSWKLGYRIVTYLMETYGEHAFWQFHRSIIPTTSYKAAKQEELSKLKLHFGDDFLEEFCDWYLDHLTRFGDEDLRVYGDWMIDDGGYLVKYFGSDTDLVIPDTVKYISSTAFKHCDTMKTITIPDTVMSIGGAAFLGCKNLTKVKLPSSITAIYVNTFEGCTSLQKVILPDTIDAIYTSAFADCTALTSIKIPEGVTLIDGWAFAGCSKLSNVALPSTLKSIGPMTFYGCKITKITIPESVTEISKDAFGNNTNLTITGVKGSYAEKYAKQNNYKFITK